MDSASSLRPDYCRDLGCGLERLDLQSSDRGVLQWGARHECPVDESTCYECPAPPNCTGLRAPSQPSAVNRECSHALRLTLRATNCQSMGYHTVVYLFERPRISYSLRNCVMRRGI